MGFNSPLIFLRQMLPPFISVRKISIYGYFRLATKRISVSTARQPYEEISMKASTIQNAHLSEVKGQEVEGSERVCCESNFSNSKSPLMSDSEDDPPKNKDEAPVNETSDDEEDSESSEDSSEDEESQKKKSKAVGEVRAIQETEPEPLPASESVGTKEKKGKTLRFALPEEDETHEQPEQEEPRLQNELEIGGVQVSPLPKPQPRRVSDVVKALETEALEDEFGPSVCLDTETQVIQPANFAFKALFDALKRSPTKSQADYHLLLSAHLRCLEGVIQSLEQGANVNVTQDHLTPLIIATENNDKPMVRYLVTVKGVDLNARNIFGCCPLLIALKNGFDEIATLLLQNNADLNVVDNLGRTALHEAVLQENYDMVKLLIRGGHELESLDCFGEKPIYTCAVKKPNLKLLNLLLHSGASCEYENVTGLSLLSRAILHTTNLHVIKKLIMAGANVNHQDYFCKRTPLHMAATIDNVKIAKFLVEHGADPDLKTIAGYTAFDLALYYRCLDVGEYLAIYTKNAALSAEHFNESLLSRVPKHGSALFLLIANAGSPSRSRKNTYVD